MENRDKIDLLLRAQEHPELMTEKEKELLSHDEELQELTQHLATAKRAFMKREAEQEADMAEEEWQKFAATHLPQRGPQARWTRVAAILAGIIFLSGIALAAIRMGLVGNPFGRSQQSKQVQTARAARVLSTRADGTAETASADSTATRQVVFDNVALAKILTDISAHYGTELLIENEQARELRFYFVWEKTWPIDRVVRSLNNFERVNILHTGNQLIVK